MTAGKLHDSEQLLTAGIVRRFVCGVERGLYGLPKWACACGRFLSKRSANAETAQRDAGCAGAGGCKKKTSPLWFRFARTRTSEEGGKMAVSRCSPRTTRLSAELSVVVFGN